MPHPARQRGPLRTLTLEVERHLDLRNPPALGRPHVLVLVNRINVPEVAVVGALVAGIGRMYAIPAIPNGIRSVKAASGP
jgi:hypothetical protein